MDAAGAEMLRQRIEAYNTTGRRHESAGAVGTPPITPAPMPAPGLSAPGALPSAHDYLEEDESDIPSRPALRQWMTHHQRTLHLAPALELSEIEANGGGAGALNRRILEEQERTRLARPATDRRASPIGRRVDEPHRAGTLQGHDSGWHLPTVAIATGLAIVASMLTSLSILGLDHRTTQTSVEQPSPAPAAPVTPAVPAGPQQAVPSTGELSGIASYNPYGTGPEHSALVGNATDGSAGTYWSTETYSDGGFSKPGTGLVLAATGALKPETLELVTDSPGYQAQIRIGDSPTGKFVTDSGWKTVTPRTVFALRGLTGRYLLVWIRLPGHTGSAHVNEVKLRD